MSPPQAHAQRLCLAALAVFMMALPLQAEPSYIYGIHDPGGEWLMGSNKGYIVFTRAIGSNPNDFSGENFSAYSNNGYGVIVRVNNGYGSAGTLPFESQYGNWATRCKNYIAASSGVDYWIIANETNLPREWPGNINGDNNTGEPITSARYINAYNQTWVAVKNAVPSAKLIPSPIGVWAPPYPGQGIEPFDDYYVNVLNGIAASRIDAVALHAYTHGCDPAMVTSSQKMGPPYTDIHFHFRVYQDQMNRLPSALTDRPVFITECDQNIECASGGSPAQTWYNVNNGWTKAIYAEINNWNQTHSQDIRTVAMFRWELATEGAYTFSFQNLGGVHADFQQAVAYGYQWSGGGSPPPPPPPTLDGTNIAPNSTQVSVDSTYATGWEGDNAIDGTISSGSKWVSAGSSPPHWLALDLGGDKTIYGVKVQNAQAGGEPDYYNTEDFTIQTGTSISGPWTTQATYNNNTLATVVHEFSSPLTSRYIRINITDPGIDNYVRLPEFEVWGEDAPGGGGGGDMVDAVPSGSNLSLSATQVAVSASYNGGTGGDKAIDGVTSSGSKWTSDGSAMPEWLKLDLGSTKTVNGFIVRHAEAGGEAYYLNTEQFRIQSGTSYNGPWTDETVVDNSAQDDVTYREYVTPQSLRYIRLYIEDAGIDNYVRLPEFEVIGDAGGGGGGPITIAEDFNSMPGWSSTFDAGWGSAASWSIVGGGQSGNALEASRSSQGSSANVSVYNITANTSYTISVYIKCPSYGGAYWAETAFRLGNHSASNFDGDAGNWTMIKKFDNGGTNGNGNSWTQYSVNFNSGSDTQISVGYKSGSSGGGGPTVLWDTLRID